MRKRREGYPVRHYKETTKPKQKKKTSGGEHTSPSQCLLLPSDKELPLPPDIEHEDLRYFTLLSIDKNNLI